MADIQGLKQRWEEFRPSKTMTFWSCVACIGLTILVGFAWGGWVTGGTSKEMAQDAAADARAQLAATGGYYNRWRSFRLIHQRRRVTVHLLARYLPTELSISPVECRDVGSEHLVDNQDDVLARNDRTRRVSILIREGAQRRLPTLLALDVVGDEPEFRKEHV